jgi:hypothetical protein
LSIGTDRESSRSIQSAMLQRYEVEGILNQKIMKINSEIVTCNFCNESDVCQYEKDWNKYFNFWLLPNPKDINKKVICHKCYEEWADRL